MNHFGSGAPPVHAFYDKIHILHFSVEDFFARPSVNVKVAAALTAVHKGKLKAL